MVFDPGVATMELHNLAPGGGAELNDMRLVLAEWLHESRRRFYASDFVVPERL